MGVNPPTTTHRGDRHHDADRRPIPKRLDHVPCAPIGLGLWEVRSSLPNNRIARMLFTPHEGQMVLLHGFVKKTQKTPETALDIARERMKELKK